MGWGWGAGGYDRVMAGEGGWWSLGAMVWGWVWEWVMWAFRRGRMGTGEVVNAAMREDGRGEDGIVVEV